MNEFKFSNSLIERLIMYFKTNYNTDMLPEEADIFLVSLTKVYYTLSKETEVK
jgi:hypothetical protein